MEGKENLSAVLHGVRDLRLVNRPVGLPEDDEVLIQMGAVGICGTDKHFYAEGKVGGFVVEKPMVIGHEGAGIVEKVGPKVKHLKEGDRVAIEPGIPCRKCEFCRCGRYNLCPDVHFCATPPDDGLLRQYFRVPGDFCFKLPDHVSLEEGAMLEPLAVGIQACRRGHVSLGSHVLVCGAGPIGLMSMFAARSMGATKIMITDIDQSRLDKAKELGADLIVKVDKGFVPKETAEQMKETLGGRLVDISLECSGQESALNLAIFATKSGGSVALVGLGPEKSNIPVLDALVREINIQGVWRYANCFPAALELVSSGMVKLKPLITHNYSLKDVKQAFDTADHGGDKGAIKVMIHCQ